MNRKGCWQILEILNITLSDGKIGDILMIKWIIRSHVLHYNVYGYYLRLPVSMTNGSISEGNDLFNTTTKITPDNMYMHDNTQYN